MGIGMISVPVVMSSSFHAGFWRVECRRQASTSVLTGVLLRSKFTLKATSS